MQGHLVSTAEWNRGRKEALHLTWVMALDYQTYNHVSKPLLPPPKSLSAGVLSEYTLALIDKLVLRSV